MVSIHDVAQKAGVSTATVSKAFNNYTSVNAQTRERIFAVAAELHYLPNTSARALVTKKSWLIGVLYSEDNDIGIMHPHFSGILHFFQKRMGAYGYDILFLNNKLGSADISYAAHCSYRGVDGVLLANDRKTADAAVEIAQSRIPCVSVERFYPGVATVISDNRMGSFQALEYLYELGHRSIAYIGSPKTGPAGIERHAAYREFMKKKGLAVPVQYEIFADRYTKEAGIEAARKLFSGTEDFPPTAIFTAYDDYACACIPVCEENGLNVPRDVSVIGFDDLPAASIVTPALTSVRQNRNLIGEKAADILAALIAQKFGSPPAERAANENAGAAKAESGSAEIPAPHETGKDDTVRIPTSLAVRETTAVRQKSP